MSYSTFNRKRFDSMKEPMFFGENVNVARYDQQKHPIFEKLIEKQLSFFWRPEEVDLSSDRKDFQRLEEHEKHIFLSNLKYQTLLDSVQGRSPNVALLPIVSIPELETWIETWSFSETIHSRSYTHIIRNIVNDPSVVFDDITVNTEITKRAESVSKWYDDLILLVGLYNTLGMGTHHVPGKGDVKVTMRTLKKALYLTMVSVNVLEAIRFYVSFACSFAFAERTLMEGNAKIIKLIARDEALHLTGTQHILNLMASGKD
ncbi:ribonucleotide-diphosphate reductase subunit beta, partial [Marinomonas sp. 42_23_T18]